MIIKIDELMLIIFTAIDRFIMIKNSKYRMMNLPLYAHKNECKYLFILVSACSLELTLELLRQFQTNMTYIVLSI